MGKPNDSESEAQATELYQDETSWLQPVDDVSQLPKEGVKVGAFCFVSSQGAVYQYTEKGWFTTKKGVGEG